MPNCRMKDLWPSVLLTVMAASALPFGVKGFGESLFPECLHYHFFHANIWHLLCNLLALYSYRPKWKTVIVAYICASVCALLPFMPMSQPTCGLSALIYACIARRYALLGINPWKVLVINFAFILVPSVNWKIHLAAFIMSYCVWLLLKKRKG